MLKETSSEWKLFSTIVLNSLKLIYFQLYTYLFFLLSLG